MRQLFLPHEPVGGSSCYGLSLCSGGQFLTIVSWYKRDGGMAQFRVNLPLFVEVPVVTNPLKQKLWSWTFRILDHHRSVKQNSGQCESSFWKTSGYTCNYRYDPWCHFVAYGFCLPYLWTTPWQHIHRQMSEDGLSIWRRGRSPAHNQGVICTRNSFSRWTRHLLVQRGTPLPPRGTDMMYAGESWWIYIGLTMFI